MPRVKKVKEFEIDFRFPIRERDLMLNPDGTDKYDVPTLLAILGAQTDLTPYTSEFHNSVSKQFKDKGELSSNQIWTLTNIAAPYSPAFKELDDKFFAWFDSRPDMKQMYGAVFPKLWWIYDKNGNHHSQDAVSGKGWETRPETWKMFETVAHSAEGCRYREINREVVYDIGDQVVLREPFKNSWRHDPCYSQGLPDNVDRVGMVIEHTENISRRSRGGKGTRLINVLWMNTGEKKVIPENKIKKYRAPKE